jgi:signal transduction histidine kinase
MNQLIDDLLAYSRLERRSLVSRQVDLPALVDELVAERRDDWQRRGVDLTVDVPCRTVSADREGLAVALRNLLDNALKFTQDRSDPRIEISGHEARDACILWVRDNGIGFDMQYAERIFGLFQRLHRAEVIDGTGIGLAIVHKAMERMRGRAWAESAPGQGACFYLEIPR